MTEPVIILQIDEPFLKDVQPDPIRRALTLTLTYFSQTDSQTLNIIITDNDTIQQLNHQYRGINAPTDVLSFENIADPGFPGTEPGYLGDVILAYPVAETQAQVSGHSTMEEITLLVVHGTLHLLGFDHNTPTNKQKMWAAQHKILTELGLAHVQPTEN